MRRSAMRIDLSAVLNALDGIDTASPGGLLLIATTNHPDELDPALSNRPGRFDVQLEVPCPDDALRQAYFQQQTGDAELSTMLSKRTAGLSFAHLIEIVARAGHAALRDGVATRSRDHWTRAADEVADSAGVATRGFERAPEMGLHVLARAART
jgi:ATP-dependent 26S proteasome regulatory subunit